MLHAVSLLAAVHSVLYILSVHAQIAPRFMGYSCIYIHVLSYVLLICINGTLNKQGEFIFCSLLITFLWI